MALGDARGNNNNGARRRYDSTFYSRLHFTNYPELTRLNITYSTGLMKFTIAIAPIEGENYEDKITLNLTGNKAKLLLNAIAKFEEDFNDISINNSFGVTTGIGEISTVGAVHKTNSNGKAITIAKVDKNGTIVERYEFNFPQNYDYSINWEDFNNMKLTKEYDDNLEFEMFKDTLKEFATTYNGAAGYNALDLGRYEISANRTKIETIMNKLGIQPQGNNSNYQRRSSTGNYFSGAMNPPEDAGYTNTKSNSYSTHKSLDDIGWIGDEEDE